MIRLVQIATYTIFFLFFVNTDTLVRQWTYFAENSHTPVTPLKNIPTRFCTVLYILLALNIS